MTASSLLSLSPKEASSPEPQVVQFGSISETEQDWGQIPTVMLSDINLGFDTALPSLANQKNAGSILVAPLKDTSIETPFGSVKIAAGSLVLILSSRNGVAVYDLDDQHRGAVSVVSSEKTFNLYPGRSILISHANIRSFNQINPRRSR